MRQESCNIRRSKSWARVAHVALVVGLTSHRSGRVASTGLVIAFQEDLEHSRFFLLCVRVTVTVFDDGQEARKVDKICRSTDTSELFRLLLYVALGMIVLTGRFARERDRQWDRRAAEAG